MYPARANGRCSIDRKIIVFCVPALLLLLGYIFPAHLWATSNLIFLPLWAQIILWSAFLGTFLLSSSEYLVGKFSSFLAKLGKIPFRARDALIFAIAVIVLYIFRSRNFLWGDSHMIIGSISRFPGTAAVAWHHYGTAAIYRLLAEAFLTITGRFGDEAPRAMNFLMSAIHALCGGFFAILAHRIARVKGRNAFGKAAIFLGIILSGAILIFTHHEFYAPAVVFAMWGIYLSRGEHRKWLFLIPTILAIILNPLLVFLLLIIFQKKSDKARIFAFTGFFIVVLLYSLANIFARMPLSHHFLPVSDWRYFFSSAHILNFVNFTIFSSPAIFAFIHKKRGTRLDRIDDLAICALAGVFLVEFDFGAMDWDLTATILLPLTIAGALQLSKIPRRSALVLLSFCAVLTLSWLCLNFDLDRGISKGESTLLAQETAYFRRKPPEERLVQIYHRNIFRADRRYRIDKWSAICIEKYPYRTMPYIYIIFNSNERKNSRLAAYYALQAFAITNLERDILPAVINIIAMSDKAKLETVMTRMETGGGFRDVIHSFPVDPPLERELLRLADDEAEPDPFWNKSLVEVLHIAGYIPYFASRGDLELAEKFYHGGRKLYPHSPAIPNNWGIVLNYLRRTHEARDAFELAYSLGGNAGNYYNNMASSYYNERNNAEAERYILRALEVEPGRAMFNINYTAILFRLNRREEGIAHLKAYIDRADYECAIVTREFMLSMGLE